MPPIKYSVREISDKLKNIFFFKNISPGAILKEMDFFSDVNESFLDEIADQVEICEFIKDDIICRHGQFNDRFYILLSGRVKVIIPTEENPRYELSILEKGDFFGEEIIFSSDPRISSILAIVDVMTFAMPGEVLKRLVSVSQFIRILMDQRYIERKLKRDLRSSPLFTPLSDSLFDEVLAKVELITIPQKSIIFNEGDVGDAFYLIREGEATVYREIENEKKIISILKEGQFFGEISLLSDEARNASVEVSCKSELVRIKRDDFLEIAQKDHNLMDELQDVVKERRRRRDDLLRDPSIAIFTRKLLDLNKEINKHLDIITQCSIDTDNGSALLATLPDSRYPYVYPRDS
ncbi:MAG: cyclic nucleotide-binding domain-containing protein, partial [Spirochaetota bacterium]|nr:cyclic nucleotide-binding domain-containing protein [Spirochaetota bacterium]